MTYDMNSLYDDVYSGGPLVIAPPDDHWIDFWTQECSLCGELADQIAMLGMACRRQTPDYLAVVRDMVENK